MGRTACTEPQCLYSRAPTSTPPIGRTACTDPQCLYKGALYLYLYFEKIVIYFVLTTLVYVLVMQFSRYIFISLSNPMLCFKTVTAAYLVCPITI
jgi:hypothetical protein